MSAEDIKAYRFRPGQSGNPNGRPKSRVPDMLMGTKKLSKKEVKELTKGLTKQETEEIEEVVRSASSDVIAILAQATNIPAYMRTLAKSAHIDLKNGRTTTMDKLRERKFGKPTQHVELTGKDGTPLVQARRLTKEEAKELLDSMDKEY